MIPIDRRGDAFDPASCLRAGGYWVGAKGDERKYESFAAALAALRTMDVPRWRRPNHRGNWGIVTGIRWS